jgi:FixJ family two-component response regulator
MRKKRHSFARAKEFLSRCLALQSTGESLTRPPLISIVDDDHSVREAIKSLIKSVGFRAETYASTEEFVQCDHLNEIACLILDIQLSGKSGLELQRQLTMGPYNVPIVFITAHGDENIRRQALKDGAVDFVYKPFSEESLLNAVHAALKQ